MSEKRPACKETSQRNQENCITESLESKAMEIIKAGSEKRPVRRKYLSMKLGVSDRTARIVVEVLRHNGERIVAHEKGGYYYAETESQYRQWRQGITARIKSMSAMLKSMDRKEKKDD